MIVITSVLVPPAPRAIVTAALPTGEMAVSG